MLVVDGRRVVADMGSRDAIAPGVATVNQGRTRSPITVKVSAIEASKYGGDLASQAGVEVAAS